MAKQHTKVAVSEIIKGGLSTLLSLPPEQQKEVAKWATTVLETYDSVLEKNESKLKNAASLPYKKGEVKLAVKILLIQSLAQNDKLHVEKLKQHFITIATFQQIDPEDIALFDKAQDNLKYGQEKSDGYQSYQKYLDLVLVEQKALSNEINDYIQDMNRMLK